MLILTELKKLKEQINLLKNFWSMVDELLPEIWRDKKISEDQLKQILVNILLNEKILKIFLSQSINHKAIIPSLIILNVNRSMIHIWSIWKNFLQGIVHIQHLSRSNLLMILKTFLRLNFPDHYLIKKWFLRKMKTFGKRGKE